MKPLAPALTAALALAAALAAPVRAAVKIAASIPDLASIAAYVGGDKVEAFSVAKANSNPHQVEVLPSYMIRVSRAAIYLKGGLALDQWADAIVDGARNPKLLVVDCSEGVAVLEKPTGKVDASLGDVHPQGNPHYWLNPANGVLIAGNILAALKKADAGNAAYYQANFDKFKAEDAAKFAAWKAKLAPLSGKPILTYHSSWSYFADAFGLVVAAHVEPFPGIPPSGKRLAELADQVKREHIGVLLQELYFPDDAAKFLGRETGIKVVKASPSCDGPGPQDYFRHFDALARELGG